MPEKHKQQQKQEKSMIHDTEQNATCTSGHVSTMSRDDAIAHLDSLAVLNGKANLRDLLEPLVPLARAAGSQLPFYVVADNSGVPHHHTLMALQAVLLDFSPPSSKEQTSDEIADAGGAVVEEESSFDSAEEVRETEVCVNEATTTTTAIDGTTTTTSEVLPKSARDDNNSAFLPAPLCANPSWIATQLADSVLCNFKRLPLKGENLLMALRIESRERKEFARVAVVTLATLAKSFGEDEIMVADESGHSTVIFSLTREILLADKLVQRVVIHSRRRDHHADGTTEEVQVEHPHHSSGEGETEQHSHNDDSPSDVLAYIAGLIPPPPAVNPPACISADEESDAAQFFFSASMCPAERFVRSCSLLRHELIQSKGCVTALPVQPNPKRIASLSLLSQAAEVLRHVDLFHVNLIAKCCDNLENSNGKKRKESGKKAEASATKPKKGHEKLAKAVTTNSTEHTSRLLDLVANEALLAGQEEEEVKEQDPSEHTVTAKADDETTGADAAKQDELDTPNEKKPKAKKKGKEQNQKQTEELLKYCAKHFLPTAITAARFAALCEQQQQQQILQGNPLQSVDDAVSIKREEALIAEVTKALASGVHHVSTLIPQEVSQLGLIQQGLVAAENSATAEDAVTFIRNCVYLRKELLGCVKEKGDSLKIFKKIATSLASTFYKHEHVARLESACRAVEALRVQGAMQTLPIPLFGWTSAQGCAGDMSAPTAASPEKKKSKKAEAKKKNKKANAQYVVWPPFQWLKKMVETSANGQQQQPNPGMDEATPPPVEDIDELPADGGCGGAVLQEVPQEQNNSAILGTLTHLCHVVWTMPFTRRFAAAVDLLQGQGMTLFVKDAAAASRLAADQQQGGTDTSRDVYESIVNDPVLDKILSSRTLQEYDALWYSSKQKKEKALAADGEEQQEKISTRVGKLTLVQWVARCGSMQLSEEEWSATLQEGSPRPENYNLLSRTERFDAFKRFCRSCAFRPFYIVARGVEVRWADCDRAVGEYDIVLLNATPASPGGCPVEVVAIAEVKRNVADLVNAQHQRVNLASEIERSRRQFSQQQRLENDELLEICLPTPNNKDSPAFEELFRGSRGNRRGGRSIPFAGMMTFGDHVVDRLVLRFERTEKNAIASICGFQGEVRLLTKGRRSHCQVVAATPHAGVTFS